MFKLRNNIMIFNEANGNRERGRFDSDYNLYVNAGDMPWLRRPNGAYLGAEPRRLPFIDVAALNFDLRQGSPAVDAGTPRRVSSMTAAAVSMRALSTLAKALAKAGLARRRTVFTADPPRAFRCRQLPEFRPAGLPPAGCLLTDCHFTTTFIDCRHP